MATVIPQVQIGDLVQKKATPNYLGAIQSGLTLGGTMRDQREAKSQKQAAIGQQQLGQEVAAGLLSGQETPQAMAMLLSQNPKLAADILQQAGIVGQNGRDQLSRTAFEIESIPAGADRDAKIQQVAAQLESQGKDPSLALALLGQSPEMQNKKLMSMQLVAGTTEFRQGVAEGNRNFDLDVRKTDIQQQQANTQSANVSNQIKISNKKAVLQQKIFERGEAQAQAALAQGVVIDAKGRRSVNSDITGLIKESVAIRGASESLQGLEDLGSAAARLAAVFKFMKALDPTSVVRESEQGQVYSASGAASQIAGQVNSILGKGKLSDEGFRDLVNTSKTIANSSLSSARAASGSYLNTYENTLPQSFKIKLEERIPANFEVQGPESGAPNSSGKANISEAAPVIPAEGMEMTDAQGNRARVFPDGTFEEIQ